MENVSKLGQSRAVGMFKDKIKRTINFEKMAVLPPRTRSGWRIPVNSDRVEQSGCLKIKENEMINFEKKWPSYIYIYIYI